MSATAQFVTFGGFNVQNFWTDTTSFEGVSYSFVPFVYQGSGQDVGGNNAEAYLVFSNSNFALSVFSESAINKSITIRSRWLTSDLQISSTYSKNEIYLINSVAFNEDRIEVRLRSPVDAAITSFPNRRITTKIVGNLPRESSLRLG